MLLLTSVVIQYFYALQYRSQNKVGAIVFGGGFLIADVSTFFSEEIF